MRGIPDSACSFLHTQVAVFDLFSLLHWTVPFNAVKKWMVALICVPKTSLVTGQYETPSFWPTGGKWDNTACNSWVFLYVFGLVVTHQRDSNETFNGVAAETPLKIWGCYCDKLLANTGREGRLPGMEIFLGVGEDSEHPGLEQGTAIERLAGTEQVTQGGEPDLQQRRPGPGRGPGGHLGGDDHRVGERLSQGWPNSCHRQLRGGKSLLLAAA